jgi:hypothetical protein
MTPRNTWSLTLLAALSVAVAAAASCSASGNSMFTSSTAGGAGGAGVTISTGTGSSGTGSSGTGGLNITIGSTGSVGGSSTQSGSTGTGGAAPDACSACVAAGGTCTNGSCTISDNPGNVPTGTQTMLTTGGNGDASFAWLYPYDKTVFPRGLISPTLQFAGTAPTSFYVHVSFPGMDYQGFYAANSVKGFSISAADWTAITEAAGPTTAVTVEVTKIAGATVAGPITETWTIAQGNLQGTIYYETYGSTILGGSDSVGIMKIQPGAAAPTPLKNGCGNVCHTASADGSTLVANSGSLFDYLVSSSYDLKTNASVIYNDSGQQFTYGGVYPDGSFAVSATGYRTFLGFGAPHLYKVADGTTIAAPGFDGVVSVTGTPAFSPDGTMIAFNASGAAEGGGGATLSVMDFDHATFTFSNGRNVATHTGQTVAWPAFTPDGKWVLYHAGSNEQFETDEGATGNVYFTSSTANTPARLDALDGYDSGGNVYLPANDATLSFAPTVLPEAVGGYFWVVFTSHRSYGNTLASMASGPNGTDTLGKLWVAAFDINAAPGADPSHPAFYLDGQETTADNLRGFWVLNPCQANGSSCTAGDQCCGGFCRPGDGGADQCTDTAGGCSNLYENCTTASDCCLSDAVCINGKCAQPPPT